MLVSVPYGLLPFVTENMNPIIAKTFGGLSKQYYFRQLFFGVLMAIVIIWGSFHATGLTAQNIGMVIWVTIFTLLYPYSRFVYESVVGFIMGDNVFYGNAILMMAFKLMTMGICFAASVFIAPIGLVYLYYHHSKNGG